MNPYSWLQRNTVLVHMATLLKQFVVEKLGNKCTNWQSISFPFTATINNNSIKEYIYLSWLDLVLLYLLIVLHIRIFLIFIDKNWTYYTIGAGNETKHSCQKDVLFLISLRIESINKLYVYFQQNIELIESHWSLSNGERCLLKFFKS